MMNDRCLVCALAGGVVLLAHGFPPPANAQAAKPRTASTAHVRAREAVHKAAAERQVDLPDAVKGALALEVIRQEAAAPPGAAPDVPAAAATELVKSVTAAPRDSQSGPDGARAAIARDKMSRVRETLPQDVVTAAAASQLPLSPEVQAMIVKDLESQSEGLARSGLAVETIKAKNDVFLKSVTLKLQSTGAGPESYQLARQEIFSRFVKLRIESDPSGAQVRMNGVELGVTDIDGQLLEPNKMYSFDFALAGYAPARREYFLAAASDDTLREPLTRLDAPGEAGQVPDAPVAPPPASPFPWIYVIGGGAVLIVLLILAARL